MSPAQTRSQAAPCCSLSTELARSQRLCEATPFPGAVISVLQRSHKFKDQMYPQLQQVTA